MVISYKVGWFLNCATVMIPIKTKLLHDDENIFFFFFFVMTNLEKAFIGTA